MGAPCGWYVIRSKPIVPATAEHPTAAARALFFGGFGLDVLRGIEGAHAKRSYQITASRHGVIWRGRRYDRMAPLAADIPNQAINHASVAVTAAAAVAVASTRAIPALGFIHEASGEAFVLDIADLMRDTVTVPAAFTAARLLEVEPARNVERTVRRTVGGARSATNA